MKGGFIEHEVSAVARRFGQVVCRRCRGFALLKDGDGPGDESSCSVAGFVSFTSAGLLDVDVPFRVEFMYFVFTRMPRERYCRRLGSHFYCCVCV